MYYSAYGLWLQANRSIPGLVALPVTPRVDVQVWFEVMPSWLTGVLETAEVWFISPSLEENSDPTLRVWKLAGGDYFRLLYADGTDFIVEHSGTELWSTWPSTLTLEDTATYLLGPVLGLILRLRGITCLHASAVAIDDQAVVLVGPAGAGKSTTAAAFAQLGYPVLSEDVVTVADHGGAFGVQPGYPCIRLWPDSVSTLCGEADALPRITPTWEKRYLDLTEQGFRFQGQPLALAAIYILGERCTDSVAPFVEAVQGNKGLIALVTNTYMTYLIDREMRASEFELLSRMMESVPLRRVTPHADPAKLSNLCDTILNDFRALSNHSADDRRLSAR